MCDKIISIKEYKNEHSYKEDKFLIYMYQLYLRLGIKFDNYITLMPTYWKGLINDHIYDYNLSVSGIVCETVPVCLTKFIQYDGTISTEFVMYYVNRYNVNDFLIDIVPYNLRVREINDYKILLCHPNEKLREFAEQVIIDYEDRVQHLCRYKGEKICLE